jgi:hypothetical protein
MSTSRLERKRAFPEVSRTLFPVDAEDGEASDDARAHDMSQAPVPLRRSAAPPAPDLVKAAAELAAPSEPLVKQKRKPTSSKSDHVPKKKLQGPSPWARFLRDFQERNPGMDMGASIIEARKYYMGPNGDRPKSYEKTWKQVWQHRNPTWRTFGSAADIKAKMREDFLKKI